MSKVQKKSQFQFFVVFDVKHQIQSEIYQKVSNSFILYILVSMKYHSNFARADTQTRLALRYIGPLANEPMLFSRLNVTLIPACCRDSTWHWWWRIWVRACPVICRMDHFCNVDQDSRVRYRVSRLRNPGTLEVWPIFSVELSGVHIDQLTQARDGRIIDNRDIGNALWACCNQQEITQNWNTGYTRRLVALARRVPLSQILVTVSTKQSQ